MSRKIETFRIKDLATGLYYTGGIFAPEINEEYEKDDKKRKQLREYADKHWTYADKKEKDIYHGKHPWNYYFKTKWNTVGKIFVNRRGAEKSLSELTGVSIHTRKTKAKNILFGNRKSNNYVIVPCRILDRVIKDGPTKA